MAPAGSADVELLIYIEIYIKANRESLADRDARRVRQTSARRCYKIRQKLPKHD